MGLGRVVTTASLGTTTSVSAVVVEAVAKARDVDPIRLPPLYDWIDPDALDALFGAGGSGRRPPGGRLQFDVDGVPVAIEVVGDTVTVTADGRGV